MKTLPLPRALYLIKRGPKPEYHRAPFHPVIVCTARHTASWEVGWSGDGGWLWSHDASEEGVGWLLERWNGLNIDYGHVVRGFTLPDGTKAAFDHDRAGTPGSARALLHGAVWWSQDHRVPEWLSNGYGVRLPDDDHSLQMILHDAGTCLLGAAKEDALRDRRDRLPAFPPVDAVRGGEG